MTKSVTVNFNDGTSHVYDNVPDDVTNDEVHERASKDYPDQQIVGFEHNTAAPLPPPSPQPSAMGQTVGFGQTGVSAINDFLQTPLGHLFEGGGVLGYGGKKLGDIMTKYAAVKNASNAPTPTTAPTPTPTTAPTPNYSNATSSPTPTMTYSKPNEPVFNRMNSQTQNMGQRVTPNFGQVNPSSVPTQAPSIRPIELPPGHPMLNPPSAPQVASQPPSTSNYIQRMSQLAEQYGGVASKLGTMARYAGPALMAGSMLKDLVYTSPEEIAALRAQEKRKQ